MKRTAQRILSFALTALLLLSLSLPAAADTSYLNSAHRPTARGDEMRVLVPLSSNLYLDDTAISGYYLDNTFYVSPQDAAKYANGTLDECTIDKAVFTIFGRKIIVSGDGTCTDTLSGHEGISYTFPMPVLLRNGTIYISLLHLYRYLGITIYCVRPDDGTGWLVLSCPYTLMDALLELFFNLEESMFEMEDVENSRLALMAASLGTMLFDLDYNWIRDAGTAGAEKLASELYEESMNAILLEDGDGYLHPQYNNEELLENAQEQIAIFEPGMDILSNVMDVLQESGQETVSLSDILPKDLGEFGRAAQVLGIIYQSVSSYQYYEHLGDELLGLFGNTLLTIQDNDSPIGYNEPMIKAAQKVQTRLSGQEANIAGALNEASEQLAETFLDTGVDLTLQAALGLPYTAFSIAWSLVKLKASGDSRWENMAALIKAEGCLEIQNTAYYLLNEDIYDYLKCEMYMLEDTSTPTMEALEEIKSDLLLTLRSAMAARRLLLQTVDKDNKDDSDQLLDEFEQEVGKPSLLDSVLQKANQTLEDRLRALNNISLDHEEEQQLNRDMETCAEMLLAAESAELIPPGNKNAKTDDDLTWMEAYVLSEPDYLTSAGGNLYYWQYAADLYAHDPWDLTVENGKAVSSLMERTPEGETRTILSGPGYGRLLVAGDYVFYNRIESVTDGTPELTLWRARLDGTEQKQLASGEIVGLDHDSLTLVLQDGCTITAMGLLDGCCLAVSGNGKFLAAGGGQVYYEELAGGSDDTADVNSFDLRTAADRSLVHVRGDMDYTEYDNVNSYVCCCQVMGSYLYLTTGYDFRGNYQNGMLVRVLMDGNGWENLTPKDGTCSHKEFFLGSSVDEDYMYFVAYMDSDFSHHLFRMDLDSLRTEDIFSSGDWYFPTAGGRFYEGNTPYDVSFREFAFNDPMTGESVSLVTEDELLQLGYTGRTYSGSKDGLMRIGNAAICGNYAFFCLSRGIYDEVQSEGRRDPVYNLDLRSAFLKDLSTGEIINLFSF